MSLRRPTLAARPSGSARPARRPGALLGVLAVLALLATAVAGVAGVAGGRADARGPQFPEGPLAFVSVDVLVDPNRQPLAAWQADLAFDPDLVRLVGVEGGEDPNFVDPPTYDPRALQGERVVLAAFHTADDGPRSLVRVARLHLAVRADAGSDPATAALAGARTRLVAAASTRGRLDTARLILEPSR